MTLTTSFLPSLSLMSVQNHRSAVPHVLEWGQGGLQVGWRQETGLSGTGAKQAPEDVTIQLEKLRKGTFVNFESKFDCSV